MILPAFLPLPCITQGDSMSNKKKVLLVGVLLVLIGGPSLVVGLTVSGLEWLQLGWPLAALGLALIIGCGMAPSES